MTYKKNMKKVPFGKSIKKMSQPVTPAQSKFAKGVEGVVRTFVKTKK